jgi:hypothetical protein
MNRGGKIDAMSESASSAFPSYRALLFRWTRAHTLGALVAALTLLAAIALQVTALSGWHFSRADSSIPLAPTSPTVSAVKDTIQYNFVGAPAVAATRTVNVDTAQVLGVSLTFDRIPANLRLSLGWVGTRDRGKPTQLVVALPESTGATTIYLPLRGHTEWRDGATQIAVALAGRPGTPSVILERAQWVSATPSGALWHAWGRWTQRASDVVPDGIGERVVPLAAWLSVAAFVGLALVRGLTRSSAIRHRDALLGGAAALFIAICVSLLAATFSLPGKSNLTILAWTLFALASHGLMIDSCVLDKVKTPIFSPIEWVSVALAIAAAVAGGAKFAWLPAVVVLALIARKFPSIHTQWRAAVYAVPVIVVLAVAQAWVAETITVPAHALIDPTPSLLSSVWRVGGLAALVALLVSLYVFWPSSAVRARRGDLALALWLSIIAIACAFAVVPTNVLVSSTLPTVSAFAMWLALAALCAGWLAPTALQAVGEQEAATQTERTEFDLSNAARQLFDAAAASADAAFASNRSGAALAPLQRMKELAPTSLRTFVTELRYALASGRSSDAAAAYAALKSQPLGSLDETAIETMLAYAEHVDDFEAILATTARLPQSENMSRRVARAELLRASEANAGVDRALEVLLAIPEPNALAHEIAELHLLRDDWQAAQKALAKSAFTPQSVIGSIYVARLGLRATNGSPQYVEQLQKLTTWHNTVGVAQIGLGETLIRQGNANGARARFLVARKIDPTLWAIERRIRDIASARDAVDESAESSNEAGRTISFAQG